MLNTPSKIRRGLIFFAFGKVSSAILGFMWLALLVRYIEKKEFGIYIAFLSFIEIGSLLSSLGIFSFIQRYLPEYHLKGSREIFRNILIKAIIFRLLTLCVFTGMVLIIYFYFGYKFSWIASLGSIQIVVWFFILESMARFFDSIFDSLIQQGYSQLISFIRNCSRIVWLYFIVNEIGLNANDIMRLEAILAGAIVISGCFVLWNYSKDLPIESQGLDIDFPKVVSFSMHNFGALAINQFSGFDALKLAIAYKLGSTAVAPYGLAQSIIEIIRRYMPLLFLLGFIRSIIVSDFTTNKNSDRVFKQGALLFKINTFILIPTMMFSIFLGHDILKIWAGNKNYLEVADYLPFFLLTIQFQALRVLLSLFATVFERGKIILIATIYSLISILFTFLLLNYLGVYAALIGAFLGEAVYCRVLVNSLHLSWNSIFGGSVSYFKIIGASILASLSASKLLILFPPYANKMWAISCAGISFTIILLFILYIFKPFSDEERLKINRMLPLKIFVW
ncbi:MAG: oligosaccharide flippase family protein [Pseudomonadota bacterium]